MLVNKIKRVQRKFTNETLSRLTCTERLHSLGADSLELSRLKLDLVMLYNIIHNNVDVDLDMFDAILMLFIATVTFFELLNFIVASMLVCTLLFLAI